MNTIKEKNSEVFKVLFILLVLVTTLTSCKVDDVSDDCDIQLEGIEAKYEELLRQNRESEPYSYQEKERLYLIQKDKEINNLPCN